MQRERGVGVGARVEDSTDQVPGCLSVSGLLDPVDEHALVVRLAEIGLKVVPGGFGANGYALAIDGLAMRAT